MAKLTVKQLKEMVRKAVREQLGEQISGLPDVSAAQKRGAPAPGRREEGGNPWLKSGFNLNQLVDALKKEDDEDQKGLIKQAIKAKLKAAGW